ncbi:DedA family protein [Anaerofustis sp. NSJ-163]|uniref:DedA family protein n=1 Tax=Anaerofustis sp. NSJ-163 TaxID=2944391 RepID=UPI00209C1132|nr:DedA family protein [Anaerofustis sp. NSJ-163]MCO8193354.1 DedA family protein [Anaerofustis sp. NSJ-163]
MQETLLSFIRDYGYIGIMILILVENIFPPIPSEVVLLFGGYMVVAAGLNPIVVIIFATIGAILGAVILYILGYMFKREKLRDLFSSRFGKILHLKPEYIDLSYNWFLKFENKAVFICRCIPVARSLISIPAGLSRMEFSYFIILSTLGTLIWNTLLVFLGVILGDAWESFLPYFKSYSNIVWILIFAFIIIYILRYKKGKK